MHQMLNAIIQHFGIAHASSASGAVAAGAFGIFFIFFILFEVVLWGLIIAGLVFWIFMIVDVVQRQNWENEQDKTVWILVVILAGYIGAIIYYFVIRKKLGPASASQSSPHKTVEPNKKNK